MTTNDIFKFAVAAEANIKQVQSKLFEVVTQPLIVADPIFEAPENQYGVYKSTGGKALNTKSMGKDFAAMQPQEFLDNIIHTVHECGANLDLSTLQFKEFFGGANVEFSVRMEPLQIRNAAGYNDVTDLELTFSTSYDGSKSNRIGLWTNRLVCTNGMTVKKLYGELKGKNTLGGKAKILNYCDEIAVIVNGTGKFREQMEALNKKKLSRSQIEAFKLKLFGYNAATLAKSEKAETKRLNLLERFDESLQIEIDRTGGTYFGLLQGVTHYTNHTANMRKVSTDTEFVKFGAGAEINAKAQDILFASIN